MKLKVLDPHLYRPLRLGKAPKRRRHLKGPMNGWWQKWKRRLAQEAKAK